MDTVGQRSILFRPDGYWHIEVRNAGDLKVLGVRLEIPGVGGILAAIEGPGREMVLAHQSPIRIGDLVPDETIEVYVWTSGVVSGYTARDITLVHDNGRGSVETLVPLGFPWNWAKRWWGFIAFVAGVAYLAFGIPYFIAKAVRDSGSNQKEEKKVS